MGISTTAQNIASRTISIEFLIVSVIATFILTYAVPTYSDYVIRAKVLDLIRQAEPLKKEVQEYLTTTGNLPTPNSIESAPFSNLSGSNILSLQLVGQGHIIISTGNMGGDTMVGQQIRLIPLLGDSNLRWKCTSGDATPAFPLRYLPKSCAS